jgi:hypothetical protein
MTLICPSFVVALFAASSLATELKAAPAANGYGGATSNGLGFNPYPGGSSGGSLRASYSYGQSPAEFGSMPGVNGSGQRRDERWQPQRGAGGDWRGQQQAQLQAQYRIPVYSSYRDYQSSPHMQQQQWGYSAYTPSTGVNQEQQRMGVSIQPRLPQ